MPARAIVAASALLLACACSARQERAAPAPPWAELAAEPLVRFAVDTLCVTIGDDEPRCADATTASAHITAASGALELRASDRRLFEYVGRWGHEREEEQLFQLYAQWPLGEEHLAATHAVLAAPILGSCEAYVGNGFGPCEITEHASSCALPSATTETPLVEIALSGDRLIVTFEALAEGAPSRCCDADVGCETREPGSFSPAKALVRGELVATRAR